MNIEFTVRGFPTAKFTDFYEKKCSIQLSSLADERCIWLGIDDPEPKIMARDAASHGIETSKNVGWVPYPIPEAVQVVTRMHLSIDQVKALLPVLQRFVETGDIIQR